MKTQNPQINNIKNNNNNNSNNNNKQQPRGVFPKVSHFINSSESFSFFIIICIVFEIILNYLIVNYVSYTEIDWSTYQQQIRLFLAGEWDYMKIEGDTGPVVYPAGYIYLYSLLNKLTMDGTNIRLAQYLFSALYILCSLVVFLIYRQASTEGSSFATKIPGYLLVILCLSKRIHSIFALRLFNDCFAMTIFYISLLSFCKYRWSIGCFLFSIAVSIKMNLLLFAPALLLLLLMTFGVWRTIPKLAICGVTQVVLAMPFLYHNWQSYLIRAFEFSRQFMYKWTVNWRFIPEDIFLSKPWALSLLTLHLGVLLLFIFTKWISKKSGSGGIVESIKRGNSNRNSQILSVNFILLVMFTSNLIGITFSRSLHYQFYVWYFHSLPYLLWCANVLPLPMKFIVLAVTEIAWNKYPSTVLSSLFLFIVNIILVLSLYVSEMPAYISPKIKKFNYKKSE